MNGINEVAEGTPTHHNDTSPDVILRSTDNVDFRTSKELLSKSSEFFQTMLSIPQPPATESNDQEFTDGLAVVRIDTDAALLRILLFFCNPAHAMVRLNEVQRVATKYQMNEVARRVLRERLQGKRDLIPPIVLSAIEMNTDQNTEARLAALSIMVFPGDEEKDNLVELELITKPQADSLQAYREECIRAAVNVAQPDHGHYKWMSEEWTRSNWFKDERGEHGRGNCNEGGNIFIASTQGKWMMRYWWRDYIYAAGNELKRRPYGLVVQHGKIFDQALKAGSQCEKCRLSIDEKLREFAALFAGEIDQAVSRVSGYKVLGVMTMVCAYWTL
jgi:hypothetical protein